MDSPRSKLALRALLAGAFFLPLPALALGLQRVAILSPSSADMALLSPAGLWYDESRGHLIVACPLLHQLAVLQRQGQLVKVLGTGEHFARAVAVGTAGTLYVAGRENESLKVLSQYEAVAPAPERTIDLSLYRRSRPVQPVALHVDASANLYVADRAGHQILVLGADDKLKLAIPDSGDTCDLWVDRSGKIYVADCGFGGIRIYNERGGYARTLGTDPGRFREALRPKAITVDLRGRIWVIEEGAQGLKALDSVGNLLFSASGQGLVSPVDLTVDAQDNLYVAEEGGNRIAVFSVVGF